MASSRPLSVRATDDLAKSHKQLADGSVGNAEGHPLGAFDQEQVNQWLCCSLSAWVVKALIALPLMGRGHPRKMHCLSGPPTAISHEQRSLICYSRTGEESIPCRPGYVGEKKSKLGKAKSRPLHFHSHLGRSPPVSAKPHEAHSISILVPTALDPGDLDPEF